MNPDGMGPRVWLLRGLCALMLLSTLNALRIVLTRWSDFVLAFPGAASPVGHAMAIALPAALILGLLGVLSWRRWAVWWLAATALATVAFDLLARGPWLHLGAALVSAALMAFAIRANARRFGFNSGGFSSAGPTPR